MTDQVGMDSVQFKQSGNNRVFRSGNIEHAKKEGERAKRRDEKAREAAKKRAEEARKVYE